MAAVQLATFCLLFATAGGSTLRLASTISTQAAPNLESSPLSTINGIPGVMVSDPTTVQDHVVISYLLPGYNDFPLATVRNMGGIFTEVPTDGFSCKNVVSMDGTSFAMCCMDRVIIGFGKTEDISEEIGSFVPADMWLPSLDLNIPHDQRCIQIATWGAHFFVARPNGIISSYTLDPATIAVQHQMTISVGYNISTIAAHNGILYWAQKDSYTVNKLSATALEPLATPTETLPYPIRQLATFQIPGSPYSHLCSSTANSIISHTALACYITE